MNKKADVLQFAQPTKKHPYVNQKFYNCTRCGATQELFVPSEKLMPPVYLFYQCTTCQMGLKEVDTSDKEIIELVDIVEIPVNKNAHVFYSNDDGEEGIPTPLLDDWGVVVLQMCKICGQAESEITPNCPGPKDI